MPTSIYLLRHGLTAANRNNIFAGRSDEPLLPAGEAQVANAAAGLGESEVSRIYCGPLIRTRQSAAIAAQILAAPVTVAEAINEISIPHWDGLSKEKIRTGFGPEYPIWLDDPAGFQVPGCETIAEVQARAAAFTEELFRIGPGQSMLLISHLIVIRALVLFYQGQPIADFRKIKVANAQLIRLTREKGGVTMVELDHRGERGENGTR